MKCFAPLAAVTVAALLGGCAVYPDGTPMYSNGYSTYDGYDAYGAPVVPQTSIYMGYGNYYGPGYYDGPGRYYGPGYHGYPGRPYHDGDYGNRGGNGGSRGQPSGGPPPQGAVGGPRGPSGSNAPRPGVAPPPPPPPAQQAGGGGGRGNAGAPINRGNANGPSSGSTNH